MNELLAKFNPGELIALVAVMIGPIIAIVGIVMTQWRRVRIAEMDGALKQQMLDKGMTADQIEQVLNASQGGRPTGTTGNEAVDRAALVQRMVDEGYEGVDIERVLQAYQTPVKRSDEKALVNHP